MALGGSVKREQGCVCGWVCVCVCVCVRASWFAGSNVGLLNRRRILSEPPGKPQNECGGGAGAGLVAKSCLTLAIPGTVTCQAPPSLGLSKQEY